MKSYIANCTDEIGWLGIAVEHNRAIHIEDVLLFDQEVAATTTEITTDALSTFGESLMKLDNGIEIWNNLKVWGHSHVNMAPTPSAQDNDQMNIFSKCGQEWFIRIIANKKNEMKLDLYDFVQGIVYFDLPWTEKYTEQELVIYKQMSELNNKIKTIQKEFEDEQNLIIIEEIKQKVTPKYKRYQPTNLVTGYTNVARTNKQNYDYGYNYLNREDDNDIQNANDVLMVFDDDVLKEIAKCNNFVEARTIIVAFDDYSAKEVTLIWNTAKEEAKKVQRKIRGLD